MRVFRAIIAFAMTIMLGACGALPVAERSLCTAAVVTGDTIVGSIEGAGRGLLSARSGNPCAVQYCDVRAQR